MVNFIKYTKLYFLISVIVIGVGLFSILKWQYRYSIDFIGGTNLNYRLDKKIPTNDLQKVFQKNNIEVISLKQNNTDLIVKTKALDDKKEAALMNDIKNTFNTKLTVISSETVGPTLGKETMNKTIIASFIAIIGILLYMSYAFKSFNFALAAIIALIHDFLVVMGTYSLLSHFLGAELDTLFVTAVLTSMSFSVHDTIIIFDKIREYRKTTGIANIGYSVNKALTETLVRSLNNSMTIVFMLLALTLLGGSTIKFFVATLLIGTITGTYSSPFIATPVLVWLERRTRKK